MIMTPIMNSIDVYVPSTSCFPGDDAADVVTPPVSDAALAPDEVSCPLVPVVEPVVLLASGFGVAVLELVLDVFTVLVAKPGDESVLSPVCSTIASGSKRKAKILTNTRLVDIEDSVHILQVDCPKKPCAGHNFATEDIARADTAVGRI